MKTAIYTAAAAVLPLLAAAAAPANDSAYGFNVVSFPKTTDGNYTLYNHPVYLGFAQADSLIISVNETGDQPGTKCPAKRQAAGTCPTPIPANVKTQFNTTLVPDSKVNGTVFMNSLAKKKKKQQLYVASDGRLQYTEPGQAPPKGSYADHFSLIAGFLGSAIQIKFPYLAFNGDFQAFYSCGPTVPAGINATYAQVPGNPDLNATCTPVSLLSRASYFEGLTRCPLNPVVDSSGQPEPQYCGVAAFKYT